MRDAPGVYLRRPDPAAARLTPEFTMSVPRLVASLVTWSAARAAHRALAKLPARELADIGLHAGDIEIAALMGRAR